MLQWTHQRVSDKEIECHIISALALPLPSDRNYLASLTDLRTVRPPRPPFIYLLPPTHAVVQVGSATFAAIQAAEALVSAESLQTSVDQIKASSAANVGDDLGVCDEGGCGPRPAASPYTAVQFPFGAEVRKQRAGGAAVYAEQGHTVGRPVAIAAAANCIMQQGKAAGPKRSIVHVPGVSSGYEDTDPRACTVAFLSSSAYDTWQGRITGHSATPAAASASSATYASNQQVPGVVASGPGASPVGLDVLPLQQRSSAPGASPPPPLPVPELESSTSAAGNIPP